MTFPHTLGLSQALRIIGVKGGSIPELGAALLPVVVLADFSDSYSAEPFETRGFAGTRTTRPIGTRGWLRVHSRGRGGIVIEDLRFLNTVALGGAEPVFIDILDTPPAATETALAIVSNGNPALPPASLVFQGDTTSSPSGAGPVDLSGSLLGVAPIIGARFHVPAGRHLCLWSENVGSGQNQSALAWREIPEPIGPP